MDNCEYVAPNEKMIELSLQKLVSSKQKVGDLYLKFSETEQNKQKISNKAYKKSLNKWQNPLDTIIEKPKSVDLNIEDRFNSQRSNEQLNNEMDSLTKKDLIMTPEQTQNVMRMEQKRVNSKNQTSFYLMLLAMSIQSLLLGFALSIQTFKHGITFAPIAIALCLYKWIEALAVGYSFVENDISIKSSLEFSLFLSFATPTGIIVGAFFDEYPLSRGILMGVGAGSFIYVSAVECLNLEFITTDKKEKILKYLS